VKLQLKMMFQKHSHSWFYAAKRSPKNSCHKMAILLWALHHFLTYFRLFFFVLSYNYSSNCAIFPYISGSLRKLLQVSCHWGIICLSGLLFSSWKEYNKNIVWESDKAIWKILQPIYMAVPTLNERLRIADEFNDTCKMPNCIGSIDGKHSASDAHQMPDLCILTTKVFTQ
jgi:hypothetical protein